LVATDQSGRKIPGLISPVGSLAINSTDPKRPSSRAAVAIENRVARLCAAAARREVSAGTFCLDRWTRHGPVRAKHAAVATLRLESSAAAFAVIEELAGIRWHRFQRA